MESDSMDQNTPANRVRRLENLLQSIQINMHNLTIPVRNQSYLYHSDPVADFNTQMSRFLTETSIIVDKLNLTSQEIYEEVHIWKGEQRKSLNGFDMSQSSKCLNLNKIITLATSVAQHAIKVYRRLKELSASFDESIPGGNPGIMKTKCKVRDVIVGLLQRTWIVVQQPYQIVRDKTTPVNMKLQLLVAPCDIVMPEITPIKVKLINKFEAKKLHGNYDYDPESEIRLLNDEKSMKLESTTNTFQIEFTKTALMKAPKTYKEKTKKHKNTEPSESKKGGPSVKRCFFFQCQVTIEDLRFMMKTVSYPVIVTTNPSQDEMAWATIFWDNMTADHVKHEATASTSTNCQYQKSRIPFEVLPSFDAEELLDHLDKTFEAKTGKGLSMRNKAMILEKLEKTVIDGKPTVSWESFAKVNLVTTRWKKAGKERVSEKKTESFPFRSWYYSIMKLCKQIPEDKDDNLLQKYWKSGTIEGFITTEEMENELWEKREERPFVLKFSEAVKGAVTLNWFNYGKKNAFNKILIFEQDYKHYPPHSTRFHFPDAWVKDCEELDRSRDTRVNTFFEKYNPYTVKHLKEASLASRVRRNPRIKYLCFVNRWKAEPGLFPAPEIPQSLSRTNALLFSWGYIKTLIEEVEIRPTSRVGATTKSTQTELL